MAPIKTRDRGDPIYSPVINNVEFSVLSHVLSFSHTATQLPITVMENGSCSAKSLMRSEEAHFGLVTVK